MKKTKTKSKPVAPKTNLYSFCKGLLKYWFFAFVFVVYLFFGAYYMGPSLAHCTDRLNGLGDSTAGPVWDNGLKPEMPLAGGFETATNYPVGENLYTPVKYSAVGQTVILRVTSKIVGPVCGYNMFNLMAYLTTALAMFGFIFYLTKSRWIALLAGYAVAYTPYVQSKIGGHPSYGFASLLILVLWASLQVIKTRKLRYGLLLAAGLAFCMYFDPYFILLSATVVGPVMVVWLVYVLALTRNSKARQQEFKQLLKVLCISFAALLVLILPLVYLRIAKSKAIDATTSGSRGNVLVTAQQCSNLPLDYLLPDPRNQILAEKIANYTQRNINNRHWCGFGESRVAISLTALGIIALGFVIFVWEKLNKRRLNLSSVLAYPPAKMLVLALCTVGLVAFLVGLPPYVHGLITPSGMILKVTTTWRVFAREYLVLNMIVVVLFAIVLKYFSTISFAYRKYVLPFLYVLLGTIILFEYQINTPFLPLTFSYSQDTPQVYKDIRDNKDINALAEYPIDRIGIEYDSIVYYLTMQTVHGKKIFNSTSPTDTRATIHIAMKDITDPQTLPALRAMGIRYIVIHGSTPEEILSKTDSLQVVGESNPPIYGLTMVRPGKSNQIVLAKILDGPQLNSVLVIDKGFAVNLPLQQSPLDTQFEVVQDAELKLLPVDSKPDSNTQPVCFDAKMSAPEDTADLIISVNGNVVQTYPITGTYSPVRVEAKRGETIKLHTSTGHNMRLDNLGCPQ